MAGVLRYIACSQFRLRGETTEKWRHVRLRVGNVRYPLVMLIMLCDGFSFLYDLSIRGRSSVFLLHTVILLVKVEQDSLLKASSFSFVSNYDCYILKRARGDHHPLVMHMVMLNIMSAIPSFDQTVEYHSRAPYKHDTSGLRRLSNRDIVQHQNDINIMILHDSS